MGKKGHLTFQKGHLIFGGGASAPHATPQIHHREYMIRVLQNKIILKFLILFLFLPWFSLKCLAKTIRTNTVFDWKTNKVVQIVYLICYQINIQTNGI